MWLRVYLFFRSASSSLGKCETEFRAIRMIPATQRSMMGGDDGLADGQADTHTLAGIRTLGIVVGTHFEQVL